MFNIQELQSCTQSCSCAPFEAAVGLVHPTTIVEDKLIIIIRVSLSVLLSHWPIPRGNSLVKISGNPYYKSEISYAFGRNPFEKREISYAKYSSDFPLGQYHQLLLTQYPRMLFATFLATEKRVLTKTFPSYFHRWFPTSIVNY